jgi:hypothetical protein
MRVFFGDFYDNGASRATLRTIRTITTSAPITPTPAIAASRISCRVAPTRACRAITAASAVAATTSGPTTRHEINKSGVTDSHRTRQTVSIFVGCRVFTAKDHVFGIRGIRTQDGLNDACILA